MRNSLATFPRAQLAQVIGQHLSLPRWCALTAMTLSTPALAQSFPAAINLSNLDGNNGFAITGLAGQFAHGTSVSTAGDINGDGISDVIIGSYYSDASDFDPTQYNDRLRFYGGASYIVFGGNDVGRGGTLDLSNPDGTEAFVLSGRYDEDEFGRSVSGAGDINGDGLDDLIIGAPAAESFVGGNDDAGGISYVVFGDDDIGRGGAIPLATIENGPNGFVINGVNAIDYSGFSVSSAGDINGDGMSDVIIGAPDSRGRGDAYIVFGRAGLGDAGPLELSELDGSNGFVIRGRDSRANTGSSVSSAGDFNNDGISDVIIASPQGGDDNNPEAESYIVYGGPNVGRSGTLSLSSLNAQNGFVITGIPSDDYDRTAVPVSAAGDINGDGISDVIIGADYARANGRGRSGQSYVVFGGRSTGSLDVASLNGNNGFVINGVDFRDFSGVSVSVAGDVNGDDVADVIIGAVGADPNGNNNAGESYVVFGGASIGGTGALELSSLDGSNGFVINGSDAQDSTGLSVGAAGDFNGDGIADVIVGSYGDDQAYVVFGRATATLTCNGKAVTVNLALGQTATGGDDVIYGTPGADTIRAFGGNDTICGLGGNDTINAGAGDDWVDAGAGNDTVFGISGADMLRGRAGADRIFGGDGDDLINGDGGDDQLDGGRGDDLIFGSVGRDDVIGQTGNDTLFGGDGDDRLFGRAGNDRLEGGLGNDQVSGENGNDTITDAGGDNTLLGDAGNDVITASSGTNLINGGPGNDRLTGGSGADRILGDANLQQAGDDIIDGGAGTDVLLGLSGKDTITSRDGSVDRVFGGPDEDVCTTDGTDRVFSCP